LLLEDANVGRVCVLHRLGSRTLASRQHKSRREIDQQPHEKAGHNCKIADVVLCHFILNSST